MLSRTPAQPGPKGTGRRTVLLAALPPRGQQLPSAPRPVRARRPARPQAPAPAAPPSALHVTAWCISRDLNCLPSGLCTPGLRDLVSSVPLPRLAGDPACGGGSEAGPRAGGGRPGCGSGPSFLPVNTAVCFPSLLPEGPTDHGDARPSTPPHHRRGAHVGSRTTGGPRAQVLCVSAGVFLPPTAEQLPRLRNPTAAQNRVEEEEEGGVCVSLTRSVSPRARTRA